MIKYLLAFCWVIICSCNDSKKKSCSFLDMNSFNIDNAGSINIPLKLFDLEDSVLIVNFENQEVYRHLFLTSDSNSNVYITGNNGSFTSSHLIEYGKERKNYYESSFGLKNISFSTEKIDTIEKNLYQFYFIAKKNNFDIALGLIVCNVLNKKFEVVIKLDKRNFDSVHNRIDCILNSFRILPEN